jgi:hypothetical protein
MDSNDLMNQNILDINQIKDFYRIIVVGPTGMGKSQFCNFVQKDITNSINKVSESLNSCTQDPFSNYFQRNNVKYEFIDTAGSADSGDKDIENLKKLVDYLKNKKSIDFILLLLKFGERVTNDTREYIKTLGKIFTPSEFYNHLSVIFTKFPIKPSKKDIKTKNQSIEEINIIIKNSFNIDKNEIIPDVNVYFIDTEYDEDENKYDEKSQNTIDIIMEQLKLNVFNFGPIDTTNLDIVGDSVKNRMEAQKELIEELKKKLEQEKLDRINEENEKKRIQDELEQKKLDDETRKQKEIELKRIENQLEEKKRNLERMNDYNKRIAKENERRKKLIEEEALRKGIVIEQLEKRIDTCKKVSKISLGSALGMIALCAGVFILSGNPTLVPCTALWAKLAFFGGGIGGVSSGIISGTSYGMARHSQKKKDNL